MRRRLIFVWLSATFAMAGYLAFNITAEDRSAFLPGATTDGHYQIELACNTCHTPFGGVQQSACLDCHQAELAAEDSHSAQKFSDPRYAGDLARLDVRQCITCHTEHRPAITAAMGVTLPPDFCYHCHANVAEERPTHQGIAFDTCASAGCHNYHDNRALYEDFLVQHGDAGPKTFAGKLPERNAWMAERTPLTAADADGPPELIDAWAGSAHARAGVACSDCHQRDDARWPDHPPRQVCRSCHEQEFAGFTAGKHGMRWSVDFASLSPAQARLPMQPKARSSTLDCGACHDVHAVDVQHAAVDACLACHADEHSMAYKDSPHFRRWQSEPERGASCATCHLPRTPRAERIVVQHNQNANLRPNEKMIRPVCLTCHSLALSIDALADPDLIRRNFSGLPARQVQSIDMALSRTE